MQAGDRRGGWRESLNQAPRPVRSPWGWVSRPYDRDLSQSQQSDAQPTEAPGHPQPHMYLHRICLPHLSMGPDMGTRLQDPAADTASQDRGSSFHAQAHRTHSGLPQWSRHPRHCLTVFRPSSLSFTGLPDDLHPPRPPSLSRVQVPGRAQAPQEGH